MTDREGATPQGRRRLLRPASGVLVHGGRGPRTNTAQICDISLRCVTRDGQGRGGFNKNRL